MFIGHYGVSFAAKPIGQSMGARVPLWVLVIAAQWLDVVWSVLVLLGIEKVRVVPGSPPSFDLYYMPYTHGLPGAIALSLLLGAAVALLTSGNRAMTVLLVAAVSFSHWILDLVVHAPDLPLYDNAAKIGFDLGRNVALSFPLELIVLGLGAWLYARMTPLAGTRGRYVFWAFVMFLAAVQVCWDFGIRPTSPEALAVTTLASYVTVALLAAWMERVATVSTQPRDAAA